MMEARIESTRGSLYFAAEATPYDLEMLRLHVRDLTPRNRGELRLEVKVDARDPAASVIGEWLARLAASGVNVARWRAGVSSRRVARA